MTGQLGRKEGFDVGLEMSGNGSAFNDMLQNMCYGGKVALLGIHGKDTCIDWDRVVFSGVTIKGIKALPVFKHFCPAYSGGVLQGA